MYFHSKTHAYTSSRVKLRVNQHRHERVVFHATFADANECFYRSLVLASIVSNENARWAWIPLPCEHLSPSFFFFANIIFTESGTGGRQYKHSACIVHSNAPTSKALANDMGAHRMLNNELNLTPQAKHHSICRAASVSYTWRTEDTSDDLQSQRTSDFYAVRRPWNRHDCSLLLWKYFTSPVPKDIGTLLVSLSELTHVLCCWYDWQQGLSGVQWRFKMGFEWCVRMKRETTQFCLSPIGQHFSMDCCPMARRSCHIFPWSSFKDVERYDWCWYVDWFECDVSAIEMLKRFRATDGAGSRTVLFAQPAPSAAFKEFA